LAPIEQSIGATRGLVTVGGAMKRLLDLDNEDPYRTSALQLAAPSGALSVENLVYRVAPDRPAILKAVSFSLEAGESLAIIGPSGAGKSVLSRLLVGAVAPSHGIVRLDGADIFTWNRADVGKHVGYLPQDIELFSGTVAENIGRFSETIPPVIVAAAQLAGVHEMILRLPSGYETEIGDGGGYLSSGQRQRIGLARAVLGQPKLVVLDEPNSNLDGEGEIALLNAIRALKAAGSTLIIVAHRPTLVQHVDKVLMLRDGKIEQFGARQEVLARIASKRMTPDDKAPNVVPLQSGGSQ
jgi:ATP-binding cassette subfamily C protein/ATP-binding cassette subfamily C protein EexD